MGVKVISGKTLFSTLRRWLIDNELEILAQGAAGNLPPHSDSGGTGTVCLLYHRRALILGLFLGFRYQISGPDLEDETFNGMMGNVADTAADLGRQVMEELKNQHDKYNNRKK